MAFEILKETDRMSDNNNRESWVERHWSWLVILFGILFVLCIDNFNPRI